MCTKMGSSSTAATTAKRSPSANTSPRFAIESLVENALRILSSSTAIVSCLFAISMSSFASAVWYERKSACTVSPIARTYACRTSSATAGSACARNVIR